MAEIIVPRANASKLGKELVQVGIIKSSTKTFALEAGLEDELIGRLKPPWNGGTTDNEQ